MYHGWKREYLLVIGALNLLLCAIPRAWGSPSTSGTINAQALTAISVVESGTQHMNFGMFVPGSAADTIVLTPAGSRTNPGGHLQLLGTGVQGDLFTVTGDTSYPTFSITLPSSAVTITSGANTMSVDTFTSSPSGSGTLSSGTLTVTVGATLHVGASQASGSYTGTYTFTVAYQ